jgi:hypothetical protein
MILIYIFLIALAILLIINIILTLKAGKNETGNGLTEIKSSIITIISKLIDTKKNLKDEFVTRILFVGSNCPYEAKL